MTEDFSANAFLNTSGKRKISTSGKGGSAVKRTIAP